MPRMILFVCDGNIFRSVAAMALARSMAAGRGVADEYCFNSAGIYGRTVGLPPNPVTVAELMRYGVDISNERARTLSAQEAHAASLIVTMDRQQQLLITACFGVAPERILPIYELIGERRDMPDVGEGGQASIPIRVAQIYRCLAAGWGRLLALAGRDVPVWAAPLDVKDGRIQLRPLSLPGNLPCSWGGHYQYLTTAGDPRVEPRWSRAGERVTLPEVGLDVEQVVLEELPRIVHVSAGGVVYRRTGQGMRFALGQRCGETHWELPGGTVEGRETLRQTAVRELREETGYDVHLRHYLRHTYDVILDGSPKPKVRHHFLAEAGRPTAEGVSSQVRCVWLPADEACSRLSWEERAVLRMALAYLNGS